MAVQGTAETSAGHMEVRVPAVVQNEQGGIDEIVVVGAMDDREGAGGTFSAVVYDEDGNRVTDEVDVPRSPEVSLSDEEHPGEFVSFEGGELTTISGRISAGHMGAEIAIEFNGDEVVRAPVDEYRGVAGGVGEILARAFGSGGVDEARVAELEGKIERQSEAIAELRAELTETQDEADVDVPDGGSSFGELGEAAGAFLNEIIDG